MSNLFGLELSLLFLCLLALCTVSEEGFEQATQLGDTPAASEKAVLAEALADKAPEATGEENDVVLLKVPFPCFFHLILF